MVKVFIPDPDRLENLGFGEVKHVPALWDTEYRYCREHNLYLRARACLDWHPSESYSNGLLTRDRPRKSTLLSMAHCLANFVAWCEANKRDWKDLTYKDILKYQHQQVDGKWSLDKRALRPATANRRADEATHFLEWAAMRGMRPPFPLKRINKSIAVTLGSSSRRTIRRARVRPGRAKVSMTDDVGAVVHLPSPNEVRDWLMLVQQRRGYSKALACRFILETGVRRDELVNLNCKQLPEAEALDDLGRRGKAFAPIHLEKTKGGRPRTIAVPLAFTIQLRQWADTKRLVLPVRYKRRTGRHLAEEDRDRLFLSDSRGHEGTPIEAHTIYRVFKDVRPGPSKWHPHFGRHAFACFSILHSLEDEAKAYGGSLKDLGPDWIAHRSQYWLAMLRRQLGHVDESTTHLYLRWLQTAAGVAELAAGWHRFLNEPVNTTETC